MFKARIARRPGLVLCSVDAAQLFYRPGAFPRAKALPPTTLMLLQGQGSAQTLEVATTAPGADERNAGTVTFQELANGRGARVKAVIASDPPGGAFGRLVAKSPGREPAIQARQELKRFKDVLETGQAGVIRPTATPPPIDGFARVAALRRQGRDCFFSGFFLGACLTRFGVRFRQRRHGPS